jgi:hypothetical protein
MVEEMLAARGISVTHETIRQWGLKFGREFANRIRRGAPRRGDKWHLDEVVISFAGKKHWLWRAVDQDGFVLDGERRGNGQGVPFRDAPAAGCAAIYRPSPFGCARKGWDCRPSRPSPL